MQKKVLNVAHCVCRTTTGRRAQPLWKTRWRNRFEKTMMAVSNTTAPCASWQSKEARQKTLPAFQLLEMQTSIYCQYLRSIEVSRIVTPRSIQARNETFRADEEHEPDEHGGPVKGLHQW